MQWLKDYNGQWTTANNYIKLSDYLQHFKSNDDLNIVIPASKKPVIYIPTHNINDVFEWFRIFGNTHVNGVGGNPQTYNLDKLGFWIHAYFDKERCQSIRDFFPNLIEVKAASTETYTYDNDERYSNDFLDIFASYPKLFVDGVEVFDTERILLKNQYYETLTTDVVNYNLSTQTTLAILYYPNAELVYAANTNVRIQDINGNWYTKTVVNSNISGSYLYIDIDSKITDVVTDIGSIENGIWTKTDFPLENGVYTYANGSLIRHPNMNDKYKTYNQIVYCYQGLTQQNNEYYLRRVDDLTDVNYSYYPYDSLPFVAGFTYSKGNAHLIKFEFDYNLDLLDPAHPIAPPFNQNGNEANYRLLFLDYDTARKIMLKDKSGLGDYLSATGNLGGGFWANGAGGAQFAEITFNPYDSLGNPNVIQQWLDQDYYNCFALTGVTPELKFRSVQIFGFNEVLQKLALSTIDTISYTQNANTTTIDIQYGGFLFDYIPPSPTCVQNGDLIHLKWEVFYNGGSAKPFLDENFVVISNNVTYTNITLEIFPKLDDNIINELTSYSAAPSYHSLFVDIIASYGKFTWLVPISYTAYDEAVLLIEAINKTHLKDIYQFDYDITNYPYVKARTATTSDIPLTTLTGYTGTHLDTRYYNPPIGVAQVIFNLVQDWRYGSIGLLLLNPGDLIVVSNQIDQTLNGVYEWRGIGAPMLKQNYPEGTIFHIQDGASQFLYLEIVYTENPGGPTLPDYVSFNNAGNSETLLTIYDVKQSHDWKWFNHAIRTTINPFGPTYIDFNNTFNSVDDIYGQEYTVQKYLDSYLNIVNNLPDFPNIDIAQFGSFAVSYDNSLPVNNPTRIGFERNKIYFGSVWKEIILDNVKRHTWIDIIPTFVTPTTDVFVIDVTWDDETQLGTIELYHQFTGAQIPGLLELVTIAPLRYLPTISNKLNDTDLAITYKDGLNKWHTRPDSGSYAHALMNYVFDTATIQTNDSLLNNITAIWFKELGEPRISFRKREKRWQYINDGLIEVAAATTANINIAIPPPVIDGYALTTGDLILLKDQLLPEENGTYVYNTSPISLVRYSPFDDVIKWSIQNGGTNANKIYQATFFHPVYLNNALEYGVTVISMFEMPYSLKKDNRLFLKPIEIAKLGVDNDTQPWQKISAKYDTIETEENLLNIEIGINNRRRIRFIDGLTETKILNNIGGQGQYDWILDDNVVVFDAVVGCTQDNGPGTGTLIWYTGTWSDGVWVNGIWMQGTWENGTWLNGEHNAYQIQDFWYYVLVNTTSQVNNLSRWFNGVWADGVWHGGEWSDGIWDNGIWVNGLWKDGLWKDGEHYCGIWNAGTWEKGIWYGGDFEKGEWKNGTFSETVNINSPYTACAARFGVKALSSGFANHAIWRNGTFKSGGEFMSGINIVNGVQKPSTDHRAAIWFAGMWEGGIWWGGTFVAGYWNNGLWKDGVWMGGYKCTISDTLFNTIKQLNINPNQYLALLGVTNANHNLHKYGQAAHYLSAITTGFPTTPPTIFADDAFVNIFEYTHVPTLLYTPKTIAVSQPNNATTLYLQFQTNVSVIGTTYQIENIPNGDVDGTPMVLSVWNNGTWENGTWLNGYWNNGLFERGTWANGYWRAGIFGQNIY